MAEIHAAASAMIGAPAAVVYGIIADYRVGHPSILPAKYFQDLRVEQGGTGAGTRIVFQMRAFGRTSELRAEVSEPEPGRELWESYPATGMVTRFVVEPRANEPNCQVTISTRYTKAGLAGWIEGWLVPGYLRTVFGAELEQLDQVARARAAGA